MNKSSVVCYAMKALWLVAIFFLINMGLSAFGFNIFEMELMQTKLNWLIVPLQYLAGIAGVLGLLQFVRALNKDGNWCGCEGDTGSCK